MLVLIPPSEGKTPPLLGPRLDMAQLDFPELSPVRTRVASALIALCRGPRPAALKALGISARMSEEIDRNAKLRSSPSAPAAEVYTGVLFDALDWTTLPAAARRRAARRLAIASALWGLVRPGDAIPAYRLSADTSVPGLPGAGTLRAVWSEVLPAAIARTASRGIVVDLRSAAYVHLGPVPVALAGRTAQARVLTLRAGKKVVVSHHNKATKGRLVRSLLLATSTPRSIDEAAQILAEDGHDIEVHPGRREIDPWTIDVIVDQP